MSGANEVGLDALRALYRAYVQLLESGRDRIVSLGGDCDPVERMESGDPALHAARAVIAKLEALAPQQSSDQPCGRCQGNGEIVTDWERYLHAHDGDKGDEAVADCPDCDGSGKVEQSSDRERVERLRAVELLRHAAAYIRASSDHDRLIHYDDADCDGLCLADDCDATAEALHSEPSAAPLCDHGHRDRFSLCNQCAADEISGPSDARGAA